MRGYLPDTSPSSGAGARHLPPKGEDFRAAVKMYGPIKNAQKNAALPNRTAYNYSTLLKKSMVRCCFGWPMTSSGVPSSTM